MSETVGDLKSIGEELLVRAAEASSGRATEVLHAAPGGALTQIALALRAGRELSEHENPGHATLQILTGRVRLTAGAEEWDVGAGSYVVIPQRRHALVAIDDSTVVLTVVKVA